MRPEKITYHIVFILVFLFGNPSFSAQSFSETGPGTMSELILHLDSIDPGIRADAADGLGKSVKNRSLFIKEFIRQVSLKDVKEEAQSAYTENADSFELLVDSTKALLTAAGDIHSNVRYAAVSALNKYGLELDSVLSGFNPEQKHNPLSAEMTRTVFNLKYHLYIMIEKLMFDSNYRVSTTSKRIIQSLDKHSRQPVFANLKPWKEKPVPEPEVITVEKEADFSESADFDFFDPESENKGDWYSLTGYLESENYIPFYYDFRSGTDTYDITDGKSEVHLKVDLKLGDDVFFLKAITHGYAYVPGDSITHPSYENRLQVSELFVSCVKPGFDIQVGKQIIKWGKADAINPTSYFNPYDLTENLLKDDDELFPGIPALSGKILFGDYSLKAVIAPFHTPPEFPEPKSPWAFSYPDTLLLPTTFRNKSKDIYTSAENTGLGLRFTGATSGLDFSVSCYHGPDRDITLVPELNGDHSTIEISPHYEVINTLGADIAVSYGNFTFQGEATFTRDKPAVPDPLKTGVFPHKVETEPFVYWTGGVTWLTPSDYTIIVEYIEGFYTRGNNYYYEPFFSGLVSASLKKQFFNETFSVDIQGLYNINHKDSVVMPEFEWSLSDSLKLSLLATIFSGKRTTLFGSYEKNDNAGLKLKYFF